MDISVKITPYLIQGSNQPQQGNFTQPFSYHPPQENVRKTRGQLFALISLASPDPSLDLPQLAKLTWDNLHQEYFNNLTGSPPSALTESLEKVQVKLKSWLLSPQSGQEKLLSFNLQALVIWGNVFYLACIGEGTCLLWRNQALQEIPLGALSSDSLQENDLFILSTKHFAKSLGPETLSQILIDNEVPEALASLKEEAQQQETPAKHALIALWIKQDLVPSEEEVIEIYDVEVKSNKIQRLVTNTWQACKYGLFKVSSDLKSFKLLTRLPTKISLPQLGLHSSEVYIKKQPGREGSKRSKLIVLGLLVGFFILSILLTRWYRQQQASLTQARKFLVSAEQKATEGKEMAAVNPERAKKVLQEAKTELGQVLGLEVGSLKLEVGKLEEEIRKTLAENYKIERLSTTITQSWPKETFNLTQEQTVVNSQNQVLLEKDAAWQSIVAVEEYFKNLYLLDAPANQIHKYIAIPQGFSKRFDYFKQAINLGEAIDFAIDGNIFILFQEGRLEKYLGGEREEFGLSGFYPPLNFVTGIFTSRENEKLYLFGQNQVLVFNKDGSYQKGFELEGIEEIEDLFINEAEKTIWLQTESKILTASY